MHTSSSLPVALLPTTDALQLDTLTVTAEQITATLLATRSATPCPRCGILPGRIHSHYSRTLTDLPWGQHRVRLELTVRKFRCATPSCPRRVFTERLPDFVAPYARRTLRLTDVLRLLAFALGGEVGSRLVARLQFAASPATLLRLIRRTALTEPATPRVLGIDDFAFRKGHTYGTILVDLEQHTVLDLLPERSAEAVVPWLKQHPGITVITRDRAQAYAEAASNGAPQAQQVADRWHLLHNLAEALEAFLLQKRPLLRTASTEAVAPAGAAPPLLADAGPGPLTPRRPRRGLQRLAEVQRQRHARLVEQYETIQRLAAAGATTKLIADQVGVSRGTVYRYRNLSAPPEPRRPHRPPRRRVLTPYEPYLLQRWQEGCHVGMRLYRELRERGYRYGASNVMRFVAALRREEAAGQATGTTARARAAPIPTARHVAALFLRRPENLDGEEDAYLSRLRAGDGEVAAVYDLAQAFITMARERAGARLDGWLTAAEACAAPSIQRFATGLRTDDAAVRAGLTEVWSNGQTEGQVNKLKLIKRQMYGRAKVDLLRLRVLRAA